MYRQWRLFIQNKKTWINNLIYMLYSVILLIIVLQIDMNRWGIKAFLPDIVFTGVDLARDILTAMAAALLSIATFTFSITLSVMGSYASNMTPRAVEDFIEHRVTMKVLGIFIGGFFYAIIMLQFMRYSQDETQVVSGTVAILYALLCILYLVRFIQFVVLNIQVGKTASSIRDKAMVRIDLELATYASDTPELNTPYAVEIRALQTGFLNFVSEMEASRWLTAQGAEGLVVQVCCGDYVVEGDPIATVYFKAPTSDLKSLEQLATAFAIQDRKAKDSDYHHGLIKLIEIALRAISPGINDPNTAIDCIRKMSQVLARIASCSAKRLTCQVEGVVILYRRPAIKSTLYRAFHQLAHYASGDVSIVYAILEAFDVILVKAIPENRQAIFDLGTHYYQRLRASLEDTLDQQAVDAVYQRLKRHIHH